MPFVERRTFGGLSVAAWAGVIVALGGMAWLVYFLVSLGPKKIEDLAVPAGMNAAQWRVSREIDEIERAYRRTEDAPPAGMEARLNHAIALQEQLLQSGLDRAEAQTLRFDRLMTARDTVRAQRRWEQVQHLEKTLAAATGGAERLPLLAELLAIRREINRSRATARYKDLVRQTQLEREYESLRAGPLRAQADAEHDLAREAAAAEQWASALAHYAKARELMDELNQDHGRTRFADTALRGRLHAEEVALQGAVEAAEVEVFLQGAEEAAADRPELAVEYYQRAAELQARLNQRWPQSRFFSTSLPGRIEEKKRAVQAGMVIARMRAADAEATEALSARRTISARAGIAAVLALAEEQPDALAGGQMAEGVYLERKHRLLDALGDALREVQDGAYAQLVPLPGQPEILLMRGEVTQAFYVKLMRFNPSREPDETHPVDSVTWQEATEFCERLGWVLGRRVRLPTAPELDAAGTDAGNYAALAGGLAEWLDGPPDEAEALVWPADGSDRVGKHAKDARARDLGFRVVVETGVEDGSF